MRRSISFFMSVLPAACALLAPGCASVLSEKAFVQDASVTAPAGHLPIHLAWDATPGRPTISPSLSVGGEAVLNGRVQSHTAVNARGVYAVDTIRSGDGAVEFTPGNNPNQFTGSNMHWTTPPIVAGLSLDLPLSRSFALSGGLTYAGNTASGDLWGGYLGLGLLSEGPVMGFRFDAGVQMVPTAYDVSSVVEAVYQPVFSSRQYTRSAFYEDHDNGSPMGWYAGMTLNTRVPDWPIQPFVNLTLSKQTFFSYEPTNPAPFPIIVANYSPTDAVVRSSATIALVSPGLAFSLGPSQRILLGTRMAFVPNWANAETISVPEIKPIVAPFVQIDLGL